MSTGHQPTPELHPLNHRNHCKQNNRRTCENEKPTPPRHCPPESPGADGRVFISGGFAIRSMHLQIVSENASKEQVCWRACEIPDEKRLHCKGRRNTLRLSANHTHGHLTKTISFPELLPLAFAVANFAAHASFFSSQFSSTFSRLFGSHKYRYSQRL